jgi:hypothetical protein
MWGFVLRTVPCTHTALEGTEENSTKYSESSCSYVAQKNGSKSNGKGILVRKKGIQIKNNIVDIQI